MSHIRQFASLFCLLAILAPLTALCLQSSATCTTHDAACEHCHPNATHLQQVPLCCQASQPTPATEPTTALTLDAALITISHPIVEAPQTYPAPTIREAAIRPHLPAAHLILRI